VLPPGKILFLCTGNSCRSQMAEGWVNHLLAGEFEARSAGVDPGQPDPRAVAVMAEAGVDLTRGIALESALVNVSLYFQRRYLLPQPAL
jgi:protein-tyrosine-phosphatase